jgi:hypothetical protein
MTRPSGHCERRAAPSVETSSVFRSIPCRRKSRLADGVAQLAQDLIEDVVRLGARDENLSVDHPCRDPGDPGTLGGRSRGTHLIDVRVGLQHLSGLLRAQAGLLGDVDEDVDIADVPRLRPVGREQAGVDVGEAPLGPGQLGQLQGPQRAGYLQRRSVGEAGSLDEPAGVVLQAEPVAISQGRARDALSGVLRVQVEGEPLDLGAVPARQPRRPLEGDIAERSDVVGPDGDLRSFGHAGGLPHQAASGTPDWT